MKAVFLDRATFGEMELILPVETAFFEYTKPSEVSERIQDATIVITNKVVLNRQTLEKSPNIKLICIAATGTNNIDLQAAKDLKIVVTNIPDYSTPSVAQLTMTFILALASSLYPFVSDLKAGQWQLSRQFVMLNYPIIELQGKTLGIIGYGALGKEVGKLAEAFGMKLIKGTKEKPLPTLLKESDVVSIHVPLTPQTKNMISRPEMEQMKPTAFLINTARGGIVNEEDLAACLKERKIAGAALDVLTKEPPSEGNSLLDPTIPNLLLTPHIAWASLDSRKRLVQILTDNILAFIKGNPQNTV